MAIRKSSLSKIKDLWINPRVRVVALIGLVVLVYMALAAGEKERAEIVKKILPPTKQVVLPVLRFQSVVAEAEKPVGANLWGIDRRTFNNFPKELPVYKVTRSGTPDLNYWRGKLGFSGEGRKESETRRLWVENDRILRIDTENNSLEYFIYPKEEAGEAVANTEILRQKAEESLISFGFFREVRDFILESTTFWETFGSERRPVSRLEDASEVTFSVAPYLENIPLLTGEGEVYPTKISLDRFGRVVEAVHYFSPVSLESGAKYKLKSAEMAQEQLTKGEGTIVAVRGAGLDRVTVNGLSLSTVSLAYILPAGGEETLQPVFVFSGIGSASTGEVGVTVYLPALEN